MLARTPYNVTIPPHSRTILPLRLPYWRTSKMLLLKPLYNRNIVGLKEACTIVWIHRREYCPVWNDTNDPITLKYETTLATVSTIKDKLKKCSLEESIQVYRDAKIKRNVREKKKKFNSKNTRCHSHASETFTCHGRHYTLRSYANNSHHSYANNANHSYANNRCHNTRHAYAHDTRPFPANNTTRAYTNDDRRRANTNDARPISASETPRLYANKERDSDENIFIATLLGLTLRILVEVRKVQNGASIPHKKIPHKTSIAHTSDILNTIDEQHTTVIPTTPCTTSTTTPKKQIQSSVDKTHQEKQHEHEPQSTMSRYSQHQNSLNDKKNHEHTMVDASANDAAKT